MAIKAFLLAAGLGTRLRPYTHTLPKPAIPFVGIPLIGHAMYLSHLAGVDQLVINTHLFPKKLRTTVDTLNRHRFSIEESHEVTEPMGSGGALFYAQKYLKDSSDFLAINGDTVFLPENASLFLDLQNTHQSTNSLCTLVVSEDPQLISRFNPLWVDEQNRLVGVGVKPHQDCRPVHYLGLKMFHQNVFKYVPAGVSQLFSDVLIPALLKGERISVLPQKGFWWETGDFKSYFQATVKAMHLISSATDRDYFSKLYAFYGKSLDFKVLQDNSSIQFIHNNSSIEPQCITGSAFIDSQTQNASGFPLHNVVINSDCTVTQPLKEALLIKDIL